MEKQNEKVVNIEAPKEKVAEENDNIVKFTRTYNFEGEEIKEVDMSGMEDLTANDMIQANKQMSSSGNISIIPEMDLQYALTIAASATGKPIEFYKALKPRDAIKIKNKVTSFFFGEE